MARKAKYMLKTRDYDIAGRGLLLQGADALAGNLEIYHDAMNEEIAKALKKAGDEIIRVALPLTPLDTGELRSRSFNEGPLRVGDTDIQVIGYENKRRTWADEYAVQVHENMQARYRVGQAKFLEEAATITAPRLAKFLGDKLKSVKP